MPAPSTTPATCPLRPGDACRLCHPGAHGPEDCGAVYLVLSDPDLRTRLEALWAEHRLAAV